jgi:hypothetical protein
LQVADSQWEPCTGGAAAAGAEKRHTVDGEECVFPATYLGQQLTNCTRLQAGQPEVCQARQGAALLQHWQGAALLQ